MTDLHTTTTTAAAPVAAYDGYANGETRAVILSLGGSAAQSEAAAAIVAAAWWNASDEVAADRAAIVAPRADAADALRAWLEEEENPLADESNLYSSLLEHALARVNWGEVADHFQPNPLPSLEPLPDPDDDGEEAQAPSIEFTPISPECESCGADLSRRHHEPACPLFVQPEEEAQQDEEPELEWRQSLAAERERED